jgi:hypothetical protein
VDCETLWLPLVCCEPLHAPLAVHDVAFVDDHVSVALCATVIVDELRETETVGAGTVGREGEDPFEPLRHATQKRVTTSRLAKQTFRSIFLPS